jgi:phosphoadenosine phosphosulfate reductase
MLIGSPRHTSADLRHWAVLEAQDADKAHLTRPLAVRAMQAIREWMTADSWVGVSWGKDSVVVAHLAWRVDPQIPIAHETRGRWSTPGVSRVRDAYLCRWPQRYHEVDYTPDVIGDDVVCTTKYRNLQAAYPGPRISGVRAAESGQRSMSARVHGISTDKTCRPILRWPTWAVFAYLYDHDLPVHPSYAMTRGGEMDRDRLRVAPLWGRRGKGMGRREWERDYYGDMAPLIEACAE